MSISSAAQWVKFFNASGIPSPAAATYAHIFVENRIQTDMLMDLNKEYLREMGVTLMGDIIAILRHAKLVSDQNARERVLTTDVSVPIAAIAASPQAPPSKNNIGSTRISLRPNSTVTSSSLLSTSSAIVTPLPKQPRRVLPEHEGKYKIKLPTGTTERSKEILAKQAKLYSDRESTTSKSGIFERLATTRTCINDDDDEEGQVSSSGSGSNESGICVQVTGLNSGKSKRTASSSVSSSIFARLGEKTNDTNVAKQIKPILKNASKSNSGSIVKAKTVVMPTMIRPQKVLLVRKVPVKSADDSDDYDDFHIDDNDDDVGDGMACDIGSSEKSVKFASTAEVREIARAPQYNTHKNERNYSTAGVGVGNNIKARLGLVSKLHATKKTYNLKASPQKSRLSPVKGKTIRMKSDELLMRQSLPVHKRLGSSTTTSSSVASLSKRIGRVNLTQTSGRGHSTKPNTASSTSRRHSAATPARRPATSVFDRLGFNSSI